MALCLLGIFVFYHRLDIPAYLFYLAFLTSLAILLYFVTPSVQVLTWFFHVGAYEVWLNYTQAIAYILAECLFAYLIAIYWDLAVP
jgi:hypothetical protein